jgi:hypothetical protein
VLSSCSLEGAEPATIAEAAERLVIEAGERPGRCVLALGQGYFEQRLLALPALPSAELRGVLARKAANLLELELEDSSYVALPVPVLGEGAEGTRHLILALQRSRATSIQAELRACGFRIQRVVSARLALLGAARRALPRPREAALVVTHEPHALGVTLLHGDALVQQTIFPGTHDDEAAMASALVQELRGLVQFWRRVRRGEEVTQLVLAGLKPEAAQHLEPTLHACVPGSHLVCLPLVVDSEAPEDEQSVTRFRYEACRLTGPLQPDLGALLPFRRRSVASIALGVGVLTLALAGAGIVRMKSIDADLRQRGRELLARAGDVRGLEELERRLRAVTDGLDAEGRRVSEIGRMGIDLGDW